MKGEIDPSGALRIERAGKMVDMMCPFQSDYTPHCGHHCPFFNEPDFIPAGGRFERNSVVVVPYPETILEICNNKKFSFSEFRDLRKD